MKRNKWFVGLIFLSLSFPIFSADLKRMMDDDYYLPMYCRMEYKGHVSQKDQEECLRLRKTNAIKAEKSLAVKQNKQLPSPPEAAFQADLGKNTRSKSEGFKCEEVTETYVICNGNKYDISQTPSSSLLRQMKKIEDSLGTEETSRGNTRSK